jgi:TetR/AcrR family transcriptional repressor of nem operon
MSKGEQTRRRIVERAAGVFNTHGYAGTSMGELTRATGLEKGGIYNHFPSKEALATAAFDYAVELIGRQFAEAMAAEERAAGKLLAVVRVFEAHVRAPRLPGGCPVLNTAVETDDSDSPLRERARAAMTGWHRMIGRAVKDGLARGELRADISPREVATVMIAALEGGLMLSKLYDDPTYLERVRAHLCAYVASLEENDAKV